MTIRINNISLNIEEPLENLKGKVAKKLRINESDIFEFKILKESIDAVSYTHLDVYKRQL